MKVSFTIFLSILSIFCLAQEEGNPNTVFNQSLADELSARSELDQIAAYIPQGKYEDYSSEEWSAFKDSVFRTNKAFLERVLDIHGYPGYDLVGEKGERDYWVMVQHCDFDPAFQRRVLKKLKVQYEKGNADGRNYALLTDRVNLNSGEKQVYGTQVTYIMETGQAIPKALADSSNVNTRRKAVGLIPLEEYLNRMTKSHFEMNKDLMLQRGTEEPKLYEVEN
ncbi:hypothetical protein O3Q51_13920 [Cryomorphaceae bacterium 1068]|nr:hypothetical protein [Cryomorphaceae bacterium 1068]